MARHTFFVTGTDTEVGKSAVTCGLLALAGNNGLRTLGMKPVASGCDDTPDGLRNEDAVAMQAVMTETLAYEQVNPVAMAPAIAPHVAAAQSGRSLSVPRLAGFCRGLMSQPADLLLIEGAGGWRVPLNDRETLADLPRVLDIPVILVVGLRLGCINQALLSAEAIQRDGLRLAGWVANATGPEPMNCEDETFDYLLGHLPAPCLGRLSWQHDETTLTGVAQRLASSLRLPPAPSDTKAG